MGGRISILSCALLIAMSGLTSVRGDDKGEKDLKQFQGTWQVESKEIGGMKVPVEALTGWTVKYDGDKAVVLLKGKVFRAGTIKLDPSKTPKTIDFTITEGDTKGRVMLGVYKIDGDILKVCFDYEGKKRPTEFNTTPETLTFLEIQKRSKK